MNFLERSNCPLLWEEKKAIRKRIVNAGRKTAAVLLVLALSAGLFGCGGKDASKKDSTEESAAASSTVMEPINPEEVKSEDIIKEEEKPAESATQKDVIEKPEPSEVDPEAERAEAERKKEENEKRKQDNSSEVNLNEVLDGVMSFDGMELTFPIELSSMKLGKWTLTYEIDGNPADKTMAADQVVTAKMTSPDYTDDDVIVKAEFGRREKTGKPPIFLSLNFPAASHGELLRARSMSSSAKRASPEVLSMTLTLCTRTANICWNLAA